MNDITIDLRRSLANSDKTLRYSAEARLPTSIPWATFKRIGSEAYDVLKRSAPTSGSPDIEVRTHAYDNGSQITMFVEVTPVSGRSDKIERDLVENGFVVPTEDFFHDVIAEAKRLVYEAEAAVEREHSAERIAMAAAEYLMKEARKTTRYKQRMEALIAETDAEFAQAVADFDMLTAEFTDEPAEGVRELAAEKFPEIAKRQSSRPRFIGQ